MHQGTLPVYSRHHWQLDTTQFLSNHHQGNQGKSGVLAGLSWEMQLLSLDTFTSNPSTEHSNYLFLHIPFQTLPLSADMVFTQLL